MPLDPMATAIEHALTRLDVDTSIIPEGPAPPADAGAEHTKWHTWHETTTAEEIERFLDGHEASLHRP